MCCSSASDYLAIWANVIFRLMIIHKTSETLIYRSCDLFLLYRSGQNIPGRRDLVKDMNLANHAISTVCQDLNPQYISRRAADAHCTIELNDATVKSHRIES